MRWPCLALCIATAVIRLGAQSAEALAQPSVGLPQPAASPTPSTAPSPAPTPAPIPLPTPLSVSPPPPVPMSVTSPQLLQQATLLGINTPLPLDLSGDSIGIAQNIAHARGLQARILWIDGTANINSINTADKISSVVLQAKNAGFNTIVFDVKPIVGYTLYPSKFAPKLTVWKNASLPIDFDPLATMIQIAHAQGLKLIVNMAVFSEGHKLMQEGPAYQAHPEWQTVLYEASRTLTPPILGASPIAISDIPNQIPDDTTQLAYYNDPSALQKDFPQSGTAIVTDFMGRVLAEVDASELANVRLSAPAEGAVLVGFGVAGNRLRNEVHLGDIVEFNSVPRYVPISQAPEQKYTLFVDPNDPVVRTHELDIVEELATNYDIDGIIFDDRLRFAAINADFSDLSKQQFEQYVGHSINWPSDVFEINPFPGQDIIKGPYYQDWTIFRALSIRNWLADARAIVKAIRPSASVSAYVGSWYGQYDQFGENWAADDFSGPFAFDTPAFQQTGFAGLLDWISTGCYYSTATIAEGNAFGEPGATVEAAGQLSNRAVNDQTWVYGGLYLDMFKGDAVSFAKCMQAAAASTQGVMIFDLSEIEENNFWPVIAQAFSTPATSPNDVPGLLDDVRGEHAAQKAAGVEEPPVVNYGGVPGTGL